MLISYNSLKHLNIVKNQRDADNVLTLSLICKLTLIIKLIQIQHLIGTAERNFDMLAISKM